MQTTQPLESTSTGSISVFEIIAEDIFQQGYSVCTQAVPAALTDALYQQMLQTNAEKFSRAGIGRDQHHTLDSNVRKDEVCWISGNSEAGQDWLDWAGQLQIFLNRRLMLGLFSFESHFAHYAPGAFYKKHLDAFKGEANRVLSLVLYLNPDWQAGDGGELVLYQNGGRVKVEPRLATLVTFLSEEFPHEVLPTLKDRYSIAGWFRVNTSTALRVDPPS